MPVQVATDDDTCRAPAVSLRLEPTGVVQACCVNDEYPLGSIAESSLGDIWRSPRFTALRTAMAEADFSLGCQVCGDARSNGMRANSLAVDYDRFDTREPKAGGEWPRHIEFALSNTCNLQCVQCSGELSSSIRAQREHRPPLRSPYGDDFFDELRAFLPHLEAATFIGGEPFLMREARRVWDLLLELDQPPEVWVTTNGTVWDDRVESYLHRLQMGVSLSIDGVEPATIASIRVGVDPVALLTNRDRFIAATRSYGQKLTLNYCVMPQNWREFLPFLLEADSLGLGVYPARVLEPNDHSLFHLPFDGLRAVVDTMAEQGAREAPMLTINRSAWDRTLADLTLHLGTIEPPPVRIEPPRRRTRRSYGSIERLYDDLTRTHGTPPAHLRIESGRLIAAESPAWAEFLGLAEAIGLGTAEILPAVAQRLDTELAFVAVAGEEDIQGRTCVVDHDGERIEIHFVSVEQGPESADVLIGLVAAAGVEAGS